MNRKTTKNEFTEADGVIEAGEEGRVDNETAVFSLGGYHDDDYLTRTGMRLIFQCSERTLFRMVERFEIPPAMPLAGRSVWVIGRLKAWIANVARHKEEEALKEAKRLNILKS